MPRGVSGSGPYSRKRKARKRKPQLIKTATETARIISKCSACIKELDSTDFAFCPWCGVKFHA